MVKMVVYLKFTKGDLTHSGNEIFRRETKCHCVCALDDLKDSYAEAGWVLVEERVVSIDGYGGGT